MNYENAPATKLLATHCAVCCRPLLDARSVEYGIGPICRERYDFLREIPEEARKEANQLVHMIAVEQQGMKVLEAACRLVELDLVKLAEIIFKRASKVRIREADGILHVDTPFRESAAWDWRNIPGRRWDGEAKVNTVPATAKPQLWALLKRHFNGMLALGPKGPFVIGEVV